MNLLEFYADTRQQRGTSPYGSRLTVRLEMGNDEMCYYNMWKYKDRYDYEYLFVSPKEGMEAGNDFYWKLHSSLRPLPAKEQHGILKKMGLTDCDLGRDVWEMGNRSGGFSVLGTCGAQDRCKKGSACHVIHEAPCCHGGEVGICGGRAAEFCRIFTDVVLWQTSCPALDVVLVLNDTVSGVGDVFLFKGNKAAYIRDKGKAEGLYREYLEKYPFGIT